MAELQPTIADVVAACRKGTAEIAESLGRVFDTPLQLAVGAEAMTRLQTLPAELAGTGLAVLVMVGGKGLVLMVPNTSGLIPAWCVQPDATGRSRLDTLAQELGMLALPDSLVADDFKAGWLNSLSEGLKQGGLADEAASVSLELTTNDGRSGHAVLLWPLANPSSLWTAAAAAGPKPAPAAPRPAPKAASAPPPIVRAPRPEDLPTYSRSLLRIRVPVVVTLAHNRQPLSRIVELGPGSIIHFDKSCEEMLDLEVGGQRVASGEAVKVGDKFGLRITSIVLPDERFQPLNAPHSQPAPQALRRRGA